MHKKIIPILIVLLIITSVAFGQELIPKVFVNNQEIKSTVIDGEVYIPVSELEKLNIPVANYEGALFIMPKQGAITDIDTAYQVLTELHKKFLIRLETPPAKTKNDNIKLLDTKAKETFYDIIKLNSIQIEPLGGIATNIFVTKNYFYTALVLYLQSTSATLGGLKNNDKYAKKEIETIKPTFELIGKYTELAFKALDASYKEFKEEKQ